MICFVNTSKTWGGGEKWHFDNATRLMNDGVVVAMITNKASELKNRLTDKNIIPYSLNITNLSVFNVFKFFILFNFFKQHKINTVVLNLPADLKTAGIAARLAGVERIIYRRGSAIPIRNSWLNRFLFGHIVTEILANSKETKRTILANNKNLIADNKIVVIYNGLKIEEMPSNSPLQKNGPGQPVIIGNLGRIEKQKAQNLLIELAQKLKTEGLPFKIFIGGDGSLKAQLQKQIVDFNLENEILLTGNVDDFRTFMTAIDVFVSTSAWEGFGYVLAEAMMFGKPVVAFNHSSNPELIENERTGFLAESGNLDDMFRKVCKLIADENLRLLMGKNGRQKVVDEFDFEKNHLQVRQFLMPAQ